MDDATSNRRRAQYTAEELKLVVSEAARLRRPVVVHANATEAIRYAAQAGAQAVAHCNFLGSGEDVVEYDLETERCLLEAGTAVDLNLGPLAVSLREREGQVTGWPDDIVPTNRWELLGRLRSGGASIYLTSDSIGRYRVPFSHMVHEAICALSLDPVESLMRVTSVPCRVLGIDHKGVLAPESWADIVAFPGDLASNPAGLRMQPWVMQGGEVVRSGNGMDH